MFLQLDEVLVDLLSNLALALPDLAVNPAEKMITVDLSDMSEFASRPVMEYPIGQRDPSLDPGGCCPEPLRVPDLHGAFTATKLDILLHPCPSMK